jgi:WD repeat-containing protein 19
MRPEYRDDIPEAFKQKVEKFVRRPSTEQDEDGSSPCPFCAFDLPDSLLDCPSCRNALPYCIATVTIATFLFVSLLIVLRLF